MNNNFKSDEHYIHKITTGKITHFPLRHAWLKKEVFVQ